MLHRRLTTHATTDTHATRLLRVRRIGVAALAAALCLAVTACGQTDDTDEVSAASTINEGEGPGETSTETPTETPTDATATESATTEPSEEVTEEPVSETEKPLGSVTVDYEDLEGWKTTVDVSVAESRPIGLDELMVDYCPRVQDSMLAEMGENMAIKIWVFDGTVTYHGAGALSRPENTRINVTMNTNGDMSLTGLFACSTNDPGMDFFPPFGDPTATEVAHPIRWVVGAATEATPNNPEGDMASLNEDWMNLDLAFTNSENCTVTTKGALKPTESVISYPGCGVSPTRA